MNLLISTVVKSFAFIRFNPGCQSVNPPVKISLCCGDAVLILATKSTIIEKESKWKKKYNSSVLFKKNAFGQKDLKE